MSATRELLNDQVQGVKRVVKMIKVVCWVVIATGILLCLSIIGIPAGIFIIICGTLGLIYIPRMMEKKAVQAQAAFSEAAEIHEHNLRQARAAKDAER